MSEARARGVGIPAGTEGPPARSGRPVWFLPIIGGGRPLVQDALARTVHAMTSINRTSELLPVARRVLHLPADANERQIRSCLRTLSRTVHPDRPGGTNTAFRRAQLSADVLILHANNQPIPASLATQLLDLDTELETPKRPTSARGFIPDPRWIVPTARTQNAFVAWA